MHHTDCGMVTFTSQQLQGIVKERLGHDDSTHYHEFRYVCVCVWGGVGCCGGTGCTAPLPWLALPKGSAE